MNMHHRLLDVEHKPPGAASLPIEATGSDSTVAHVTQLVADLSQKVSDLQGEMRDLDGKLEEQGEHYKVLIESCEDKDKKYRGLTEKVERENWHGHLKDLRSRLDDVSQGHDTHVEKVQIMQRKLDSHEEIHTEFGNRLRGYNIRNVGIEAPDEETTDMSRRFGEIENQVSFFDGKIETIRSEMELAPRVAALVDTLKDVSPKIIDQEDSMRHLQQQVNDFQQMESNVDAGFQSRISRLENDVQRVAAEVETLQLESSAQQNSGAGRSSIVQGGQSPRRDSARSVLGNQNEQRLSTVSGHTAPKRVSIMEAEDSQGPAAGQASRLSQHAVSRVVTGQSFVALPGESLDMQDQGWHERTGGRYYTAPAGLAFAQGTDDDHKDER